MKYNILTKLCLLIVIVIILSSSVFAFGIAPSSYNYDYQEDDIKELSLRILNSNNEDLTLFVFSEGTDGIINFQEQRVSLTPNQKELTIKYSLALENNPSPGIHEIKIKVLQLPKTNNDFSETNLVDVVSVLIQKINVFVPYDGQFLQGTLYAQGAEINSPIHFMNRIVNKGTENLIVEGYISIKGATNQEISRIIIPPKKIGTLEDVKIETNYPGLEFPGLYSAETVLTYGDGKELVLRDVFLVGESNIEATSIDFGNFKLGEIVKLSFDLRNNWNQDIKSVYGDVSVIDENGRLFSEFKTNDAYVSSHGLGRITGYWDTEEVLVGSYQLLLNLHFDEKTTKQVFDMVVGPGAVEVLSDTLSGNVIFDSENSGSDKLTLLIILVVVLLGVNIFVVLRFVKKKK